MQAIIQREAQILRRIRERKFDLICWVEVPLGNGDALLVASDALKLDGIRANVSAKLAQSICDEMGWVPTTARIEDLIRRHAVVEIEPRTQPPDPATRKNRGYSDSMADTDAMVRHSSDVDAVLAGRSGLASSVGKSWVVTRKRVAGRVANYGWHVPSGGYGGASAGVRVLQPMSWAHSGTHVDYSQTFRPMLARTRDGVLVSEIAADPMRAYLVSSEGAIVDYRVYVAVEYVTPRAPSIDRNLRRGMMGADVAALQAALGITADGIFGPKTEAAVKAFQAGKRLAVDGIVGPATRKAVASLGFPSWTDAVDRRYFELDSLPFVRAANYTPIKHHKRVVVLHSAEAAEKPTTAEAVANWFAGKSGTAPRTSCHLMVDNDSAVQGVPWEEIAWHAAGANRWSVGIEHAGYARQNRGEWLDDYSAAMLEISSRLCAQLCRRFGIPATFVDAAGLVRGDAGITYHSEVSKAFGKSTHGDPGPGFPIDRYLQWVTEA